jgi:hypothetical protein
MIVERVITNKVQCNNCKQIIESKHTHNFVTCKCGNVSVDGGKDYLRRCFKEADCYTELSETFEEDVKMSWEK